MKHYIKMLYIILGMFFVGCTTMNHQYNPEKSLKDRYMPNNIPKRVNIYATDNGIVTAVFNGNRTYNVGSKTHIYIDGKLGWVIDGWLDILPDSYYPRLCDTNYLGKRIPFEKLSERHQTIIRNDYIEIWGHLF